VVDGEAGGKLVRRSDIEFAQQRQLDLGIGEHGPHAEGDVVLGCEKVVAAIYERGAVLIPVRDHRPVLALHHVSAHGRIEVRRPDALDEEVMKRRLRHDGRLDQLEHMCAAARDGSRGRAR